MISISNFKKEWRKAHEDTEKNMELYIDICTWYDGHDYNGPMSRFSTS